MFLVKYKICENFIFNTKKNIASYEKSLKNIQSMLQRMYFTNIKLAKHHHLFFICTEKYTKASCKITKTT